MLENNLITQIIENIQDYRHRWTLENGIMYNKQEDIKLYYSSDWKYTGFLSHPRLTRYNAKRLHNAIKSWYYRQILRRLLPERSEE